MALRCLALSLTIRSVPLTLTGRDLLELCILTGWDAVVILVLRLVKLGFEAERIIELVPEEEEEEEKICIVLLNSPR